MDFIDAQKYSAAVCFTTSNLQLDLTSSNIFQQQQYLNKHFRKLIWDIPGSLTFNILCDKK